MVRGLVRRTVGEPPATSLKPNAAPCCGSTHTTFTAAGICQACGEYSAGFDESTPAGAASAAFRGVREPRFEPVPPPKPKRQRRKKAQAAPCEWCDDYAHASDDCGLKPREESPKPAQVELDEAIGGAE
jgi:hypothetical protein